MSSYSQKPAQALVRRALATVAAAAMSMLFVSACQAEPAAQAGGAAAAGAPAPVEARGDYERFSDYKLEVDGKDVPGAEIYQSSRAGSVMVLASSFPAPVALNQRNGSVEKLNLMKVAKKPDGTVDLLPGFLVGNAGRFSLQGDDIVFTVDKLNARLKPNPPLIGLHPRLELLAHSPEYTRTAAAYTPSAEALGALKKLPKTMRVRIFFGSWCHVCRRFLPNALKVEELLGSGTKVAFEYYGLPRSPAAWSEPEAVKSGIKGVPTGIVYVDGKEAGRFTGEEFGNLERVLLGLANKPAAKP